VNAWKPILAALLIFCAGTVTGTLLTRLYQSPRRPAPSRAALPPGPGMAQRMDYLRRIERQLNLKSTQRQRIEQVLRESQERMRKLWEPVMPLAHEELQAAEQRIRAELTPAQARKFDELSRGRAARKSEGASTRGAKRERGGPAPSNRVVPPERTNSSTTNAAGQLTAP